MEYIVKSGSGYYMNNSYAILPYWSTDPMEATRLTKERAMAVIADLNFMGFDAELVEVKLVSVV